MAVETIIINVGYVIFLASTFTRTVTWLRLLLVLGSFCFVAFGVFTDNPSMIVWNLVTSTLHTYRIVKDELAKRAVSLTEEEETVRREFFADVSPFDFNLLWQLGTEIERVDELMIVAGETPDSVALILEGHVEIWDNSERTRVLRRGALLGEMSFVSGQPAAVDVRCRGRLVAHQWSHRDLASLDHVRPAAARAVRDYVSGDLAAKARV